MGVSRGGGEQERKAQTEFKSHSANTSCVALGQPFDFSGLSFLICKMATKTPPTSQGGGEVPVTEATPRPATWEGQWPGEDHGYLLTRSPSFSGFGISSHTVRRAAARHTE